MSVTPEMENIVIANTTGVYEGDVWYFLNESYYNNETKTYVINILGIHPIHNGNLVIMNFGVETSDSNYDYIVLSELLEGYNLSWELNDLIPTIV